MRPESQRGLRFARESLPRLFLADPGRLRTLLNQHGDAVLEKIWASTPIDGETAPVEASEPAGLSHEIHTTSAGHIELIVLPESSLEVRLCALVTQPGGPPRCFDLAVDGGDLGAGDHTVVTETLPKGKTERLGAGPPIDGAKFIDHVVQRLATPRVENAAPGPGAPGPAVPAKAGTAEARQSTSGTAAPAASVRSQRLEPFKASGKVSPLFPVVAIASLAVMGLVAFIYQLAIHYIPLIYLNFILTIFAASALALIVMFGLRAGKCRNRFLGFAFGTVFGLSAVFAKHSIEFRLGQDDWLESARAELSAEEFAAFEKNWNFRTNLELRAETGWTIGKPSSTSGLPIRGIFVYLIWLIEAGAFVGASIFAARVVQSPYCEKCGEWLVPLKLGGGLPETGITHAVKATPRVEQRLLNAETLGSILQIAGDRELTKKDEGERFVLQVVKCPKQGDLAAITAAHVVIEVDKKGNATEKADLILPWSALDADGVAAFRQAIQQA